MASVLSTVLFKPYLGLREDKTQTFCPIFHRLNLEINLKALSKCPLDLYLSL